MDGPGSIPGLGIPNMDLMKGPLFTENSILKELIGQGLADVFSQDVLEDAKGLVPLQFQVLYGNMKYTVDILVDVKADSPVLPEGEGIDLLYVNVTVEDITNVIPEESFMTGWFNTNMLVRLTINMQNMTLEMMKSRIAELAATLTAMLIIMELAKNIADAILESAEKQAEMYQLQAIQGILQAVGGFIQIGMSGPSLYFHSKAHWDEASQQLVDKNNKPIAFLRFTTSGGVTAIGAIFTGLGQAISGFLSATLALERAEWDAYKEIQETLKQLFEQLMQSSIQARQDFEEMITKTLQQLAEITTASRRSAGINPHHG